MRRRLATARTTIQPQALPPTAANTQLNYRTRVTTTGQDAATTVRLVSVLTLSFIGTAVGIRLLTLIPTYISLPIFALLMLGSLLSAYAKFLQGLPTTAELIAVPTLAFNCVLLALVDYAPTTSGAYVVVFGAAVAGAALMSHFIALQSCYFMAANERLRLRTMRRYQRYWRFFPTLKVPRRCPEIATYRDSLVALAAAFAVGYGVLLMTERTSLSSFAAMFGVVGFLAALPTFWIFTNDFGWLAGSEAPPASFIATVKASWRALATFICYNRHGVEAAGLFRFPTKALRPLWSRDAALGATLALLTLAVVGVSISSPKILVEKYWTAWKNGDDLMPATTDGSRPAVPFLQGRDSANSAEPDSEEEILTPDQQRFASQLAPELRAQYIAEKRQERRAEKLSSSWQFAKDIILYAVMMVLSVSLLCWLGPFTVLFAVLWFTAGRLLARYHEALEAPDAYEVPPEPTPKEFAGGKRGVTPWDNRIERMIWSPDQLETEHFYLGSSLEGDYPVLLHRDLLNAHAHILGDTGSRKTSIGIAPLLTQIIAREDSSVLIIDLKGDKALFESAREEAETAGMPFKWFTNIVGRSSYVFNPFAQSHVEQLTTNQLTQGILQALALEYGEDYGRGYYSALNELVLTGYLRKYRKHVRSFKELHRFLSDKAAYPGSGDDWEKTRHVAGVVDKLAQVGPLNVVADGAEAPDHVRSQIDVPTMLGEKQVVYFYLSSAQEQATVPKIAKLAMFSLLTAASRRGHGEDQRVYVFVDEFQRVISENISLFLEQARGFKLHFILANQTIGQLEKQGTNLTDVVESCTAFKQSFRATDEKSIRRIMETSGEAVYHSMQWTQLLNEAFDENDDEALSFHNARVQKDALLEEREGRIPDGFHEARIAESVGPRLEKNTVIETSALPLASFVRFSESNGYTQFSGYPITVMSEFHITKALFGFRETTHWPEADERTVLVTPEDEIPFQHDRFIDRDVPIAKPTDVPEDFDADLERRLRAAAERKAKPEKGDDER
jgi:hypothetical protein